MSDNQDVVLKRPKAMVIDQYALAKMMSAKVDKIKTENFGVKITKEKIIEMLERPVKNEKKIRKLSNDLYEKNTNYKRLIEHFADMLLLYYVLEPYNIDTNKLNVDNFKKEYEKTLIYIDNMNIEHEIGKIIEKILVNDVFYGYELMNENSYFIQELNPDYCKISSIEDGVFNFEFDFSIFDKDEKLLESYPKEFKTIYNKLTRSKNGSKKRGRRKDGIMWQELNPKNTICIKANEIIKYCIPPFCGVFTDLYDIADYKALKKAKEEVGNYKIIVGTIPLSDKTDKMKDFAIELDDAIAFHGNAMQNIPPQIGMILSPGIEYKEIQFKQDAVDTDTVAKTTRDYYNSAGVSQLLFNSENGGSIGLNKSIKVDESYMFNILRQIERWFNRKLKYLNTKYDYRIRFLNITAYNQDEYFDSKFKAAQYGFPTKLESCVALGIKQSSIESMTFLENDILQLPDKFIPLKSSHTQPGEDEGGRPEKDEDDLTESGVKTKDKEDNDDRAK